SKGRLACGWIFPVRRWRDRARQYVPRPFDKAEHFAQLRPPGSPRLLETQLPAHRSCKAPYCIKLTLRQSHPAKASGFRENKLSLVLGEISCLSYVGKPRRS